MAVKNIYIISCLSGKKNNLSGGKAGGMRIRAGMAILNIFCFCMLTVGCAMFSGYEEYGPFRNYQGSVNEFFKDQASDDKLAYTIPCFPVGLGQGRSDVVVSNLNSTGKKVITASLYPGEKIWSCYPKWSPDGQWLLFTVRRLSSSIAHEVLVELYIAEASHPDSLKEIYAYKYDSGKVPVDNYSFEQVWWGKDSKSILLSPVGQGGKSILVSLDPLIPYREAAETDDQFNKKAKNFCPNGEYISPDGEHALSVVGRKDFIIGPRGVWQPSLGEIFAIRIQDAAIYLSKRNSSGKNRIFNGTYDGFFWTRDSKFIVLYSSCSKIYIVNLEGQAIMVDGTSPDVQHAIFCWEGKKQQ